MDAISNQTTTAPAPRHSADLRPAADAAALSHESRPPASMAPLLPTSATQVGTVSRLILETDGKPAASDTAVVHRVLKPYGVAMLPTRQQAPVTPATVPDDSADQKTDRDAP